MSALSADNFRQLFAIDRGLVRLRLVTKNRSVSSFFIFCTQCLWDAVGSFLGSRVKPKEPCPAWLCEEVAVACA